MRISEEDLKKLHVVLLIIMDEVDRICKKHRIPYFLDSGTALGAVRHGGFIPWDDDVDVGMLRDDYNQFIEVARTELGSDFYLQTYDVDSYYYKFNAKIRFRGTVFPERSSSCLQHKGIFIDIFPFDYVPDYREDALTMIDKSRRLIRPVMYTRAGYVPEGIRRKFLQRIYKMHTHDYHRQKYSEFITRFSKTKTGRVACFSYHMLNQQKDKQLIFKTTDLLPVKPIRFENRYYSIMNDPDMYLRIMYGNYMEIPPVEKQVCHIDGKIVFNTKED